MFVILCQIIRDPQLDQAGMRSGKAAGNAVVPEDRTAQCVVETEEDR